MANSKAPPARPPPRTPPPTSTCRPSGAPPPRRTRPCCRATAGKVALRAAARRRRRRLPPRARRGGQAAMTDLAALSARGARQGDPRQEGVERRGDQGRHRARCKACHELTNCIITLEADEALAAAKAADAAIADGTAKGPLAGVPLAHKDMFDRKGKIASWGATHPRRQAGRRGRHRHRPLQGGRRPADRGPASDRVRLRPDRAQLRAGPRAQSLGPDAHHRRLLGRHGARRSPTARFPPASAPTPAARCACRPPAAASPRSSRPGAASAAPAPCRWRPRSTPSACIARHVEDLALTLGFLAGPDARDPAATSLPVPDYVAHLDDPVKGLRVGVDEAVIARGASRGAAHGRGGAGHPRQARPAARLLPLPRLADARSPRAAGAAAGRVRRPHRLPAHARRATTARRCAPASRSAISSRPSTT